MSPETPRLGPSVVDVSATAERTPRVARASASAAAGRPGPALVMASWPVSPACICWVVAWSMVVVLKKKVQLTATVSTSGVLAEEKRRVAAPRFAEARNPPTGESAVSAGASSRATAYVTTGPKKAAATTRKSALISDVARGCLRVGGGGRDREQRDRAGERDQPADDAPGSQQPGLDRGVGEREGRRHAGGAPSGGQHREQRGGDSAADGCGGGQPVVVEGVVRRRDAVADSACASARPSTIPGQIPAAEPTRATIVASHAIMRRI